MDKIVSFFNYLENEKNYSKNTIIAYKNDINNFIFFLTNILKLKLNKETLISLRHNEFRAWISFRTDKDFCNKSNARALSSLKSLFKFLQKRYNIFNPIISKIKSPKLSEQLPRNVSLNNYIKIINYIPVFINEEWIIKRDIALITLLYGCGLRISEAINIKISDFYNNYTELKVLGKGNKERIVPVLPIVKNSIFEYIELCPYKNKDYIFFSKTGKKFSGRLLRKLLQNIRRLLNLPENTTPHAFRHSFATDLFNANVDLRTIQELLGHKTIKSTQVYTHLNYKHLADIYNKCSVVK